MMLNRQILQALQQQAQQRSDVCSNSFLQNFEFIYFFCCNKYDLSFRDFLQRPLVEFKAGRLLARNGVLVPERTKGKVVLVFEDHLLHFQWKNRENNDSIPDGMDIILFPGDAKFGRVKNVEKGRVFVLKFNNNDRQEFFWMQEAEDDKDEEYMQKINHHINNPPTRPSGAPDDILSSLFGSVPPSQRQQQQQESQQPQQQRHEVQLDRLQDILRGMAPQQPQQQQPEQTEEQPQQSQQQGEQTQEGIYHI